MEGVWFAGGLEGPATPSCFLVGEEVITSLKGGYICSRTARRPCS